MISGEFPDMLRTVERALEVGINYFDTAQLYGDGSSEENLGRVLQVLKPDVVVGTKVRLTGDQMVNIERSILQAAETSLRRLQLDQLDLFQLHNPITRERQPEKHWVGFADLEAVVRAFQTLQSSGKIASWGINGLGDTDVLHQAVAGSGAHTIQVCYNLLNPSTGYHMPAHYPFQDYRELMVRAAEQQLGVIAFRILAGGALAAGVERHPLAAKVVGPVGSSSEYAADVALAGRFAYLLSEHWAESMREAAIRFALSRPEISTLLIGFSSAAQLDQAVTDIAKGPLPQAALGRLAEIWEGF
jgi:aryl-alcohol dehydrogenase-like predicted oxidoreductase